MNNLNNPTIGYLQLLPDPPLTAVRRFPEMTISKLQFGNGQWYIHTDKYKDGKLVEQSSSPVEANPAAPLTGHNREPDQIPDINPDDLYGIRDAELELLEMDLNKIEQLESELQTLEDEIDRRKHQNERQSRIEDLHRLIEAAKMELNTL